MAEIPKKVENPLTLIAIFSGVSEAITLGVLPILANSTQPLPSPLIWFAALFPVLIVVLFFVTLNLNYKVLYAPSDFPHPEDFMAILQGDYGKLEVTGDELKGYWKPDGIINRDNEAKIRVWMTRNDLALSSISAFIYSQDDEYIQARKKAVGELGIE